MRISRILALLVLAVAVAVPAASGLDFTDASAMTPQGIVGTPYSFQFTANEGCPPYHYRVINGDWPPGLVLDSSGAVSGSPTQAGKFNFWLELYDDARNGACTVSRSQMPFSIEVIGQMLVATASLPSADLNAPYSATLAIDINTPVDWSLTGGALPPGLQLAASGVISGTPTSPGSFGFTVRAKDRSSNRVASRDLGIDVVTPIALSVPALPKAEVGKALARFLPSASGGLASKPYAWSLGSGSLPAGLSLDPASGAITGTPAAPGTFPLRLVVADAEGHTASADLTLVVAQRLAIAARALPPATLRHAYQVRLSASGGVAPLRWRLASGTLPRGVAFAAGKGLIAGTPRAAGKFRFSVTATDALGVSVTRNFVLRVKRPG